MKKAVIKLLFIYVSTILIILPFFNVRIYANDFQYDYEYTLINTYELPAYQYFFNNGYNQANQEYTYYSTNNNSGSFDINVYLNRTNQLLGRFSKYEQHDINSTTKGIYPCYIDSNGNAGCNVNAYVKIDYSIPQQFISVKYLDKPILKSVYNHNTTNSQYITVSENNTYVIAFIFYNDSEYWGFPSVQLEYKDFFTGNGRVDYFMGSVSLYGAELCYIEFNVDNNSSFSYFDIFFSNWQGKRQSITPLYLGFKNNIPYDLMKFIYGDDAYISVKDIELNNTLSNGNDETQNIINNSNSIETDFNNIVNNYDAIENTFNNDFNNNLDNIDLSLDLNAIPKYLSAANWVSDQFNQLSSFQSVRITLQLSLILGIGLLLLGKRFNK